jgi:hypothetical protein
MLSEAELSVKLVTITALEDIMGGSTPESREMKQDLLVDLTADELGDIVRSSRILKVVESVRTIALQQTAAAMSLGLTEDMEAYHHVMKVADRRLDNYGTRRV